MSTFNPSTPTSARGQDGFHPPSAQQVEHLLRACEPSRPSRLTLWLPAAALVVLLLLMLRDPAGPMLLGLWLLLGAWLLWSVSRARRRMTLERRAAAVQELAMLRRHAQALRAAWTLLPRLRARADLHGRIVAALGHCLEQLGAADAALEAFDFLIRHMPDAHPAARPIRVQRLFALLAADRLVDADDELRRLRDLADDPAAEPTPLSAALNFARLWQMVATNHFDDAAAMRARLVDQLRPLGVEAGYGYGLLAHALVNAPRGGETDAARDADHDPAHAAPREEAREWWRRATLLLAPSALAHRLPLLASTSQTLAAASRPPESQPREHAA